MAETSEVAQVTSSSKLPNTTLDISISTLAATLANQIQGHATTKAVLTSAAPVIGYGLAFLVRLCFQLFLRHLAIVGAKKSLKDVQGDLAKTPSNRKERIKQLEEQVDEARKALQSLRAEKLKVDIN